MVENETAKGDGFGESGDVEPVAAPAFAEMQRSEELIHEPRIIPLDGRPHLPQGVGQWLGDSRGRWEGQTLIVETTPHGVGMNNPK